MRGNLRTKALDLACTPHGFYWTTSPPSKRKPNDLPPSKPCSPKHPSESCAGAISHLRFQLICSTSNRIEIGGGIGSYGGRDVEAEGVGRQGMVERGLQRHVVLRSHAECCTAN